MAELLKDPKAASATHNILGYRVYNEASGKVEQVGPVLVQCICTLTVLLHFLLLLLLCTERCHVFASRP